jgi:hypothetical protein
MLSNCRGQTYLLSINPRTRTDDTPAVDGRITLRHYRQHPIWPTVERPRRLVFRRISQLVSGEPELGFKAEVGGKVCGNN